MLPLNIEKEKRLVEMLGYTLIGPNNSNRWIIVDENNNQVGFIQYKKLFNQNKKKGTPATFGYHVEIDSPTVLYKSKREINGIRELTNPASVYELDIKREDGTIDHIDMDLGEYPSLTLWSEKYGFMNFEIYYEGLYLEFTSQTEKFNIEEVLEFQSNKENSSNHQKAYTYQIKYCDRKTDLFNDNQEGITVREISGRSTPSQQEHNQIEVSEKSWINGKLRINRENVVDGTIEQIVIKNKMGIECFAHFRFLINQILPFKKEVVSSLLNDKVIQDKNLSIIIPDLKSEKVKKEPQKELKK